MQRNNIQIAHALPSCINCLGVPLLVNPRRACVRVTVVVLCVCLFVCLSVCLFPLWRPLKPETNDTHWFLLGFSWILIRGFSKKTPVQKLWREKAKVRRQPLSRSFGTNETQQLREGQLVGRMLLQRLATGASIYTIIIVCMEGPWHLLFNVRQRMVYMNSAEGFAL